MKILLSTLNSKYIHSNLAIRYLRSFCRELPVTIKLKEFSINDNLDRIVGEIYNQYPDVLGLSCYIWNIRETLMLVNTIKKVLPLCKIILGGPEVSFGSNSLMKECSAIDAIIRGEGEKTFYEFIQKTLDGESMSEIKGLTFRNGDNIIENEERPLIEDLDLIPFPYEVDNGNIIEELNNKIIYYETSRGCPFNCQYCLSSTTAGVRYLSLGRIKRDLKLFIKAGIKQVKLVDRTFNCNPSRAMEIFKMIMEMKGKTNFHFEMCGDLIDDEMLKLLRQAPPGLFQFEIGVQSTRKGTLNAIKRKNDFEKLAKTVKTLRNNRNIHLHLDLIAGLPEEDYSSFKHSFNDVYRLQPDRVQLGFLKLLKGSGLRNDAKKWDYQYTEYPPYEVLGNSCISFKELLKLKGIEDLVEKYYNSHRFKYGLEYLINYYHEDPFDFFENFHEYWEAHGYHQISHSLVRLYDILLEFVEQLPNINMDLIKDLIKFDYVSQGKPVKYPERLNRQVSKEMQGKINGFFRNKEYIDKYLPDYKGYTGRQIARAVHVEAFKYDIPGGTEKGVYKKTPTILLFNYRTPYGIFERSQIIKINSLL